MCRQNHNIQVDYFAVGVMAFECMFGRVNSFHFIFHIEAICRQVKTGNKGLDTCKVDSDKEN